MEGLIEKIQELEQHKENLLRRLNSANIDLDNQKLFIAYDKRMIGKERIKYASQFILHYMMHAWIPFEIYDGIEFYKYMMNLLSYTCLHEAVVISALYYLDQLRSKQYTFVYFKGCEYRLIVTSLIVSAKVLLISLNASFISMCDIRLNWYFYI